MLDSWDCSNQLHLTSSSCDATIALGRMLGSLLEPGDIVILGGELGAGKTAFASGVAAAFDVEDIVWSPTFVLCRELAGKEKLLHLDLYRLDTLGELEDLGLSELIDSGAILLVEWGDVAAPVFGAQRLEVSFHYPPETVTPDEVHAENSSQDLALFLGEPWETRRLLGLRSYGSAWQRRWGEMAKKVEEWQDLWRVQ